MTASFDIATLAICLGLVNLMQFVAFIVQYRIDPSRPGPGFWAVASAVGCAGLAASFLRDLPVLRAPAIVAYNLALVGGQILVYVGILRFLGRAERRVPLIVLAALAAAAALAFSTIADDIVARRVCGSLVYALVCLASCRALLRHAGPDIAVGARAVAAIFAAAGLIVAALAATAALPALGLPPQIGRAHV